MEDTVPAENTSVAEDSNPTASPAEETNTSVNDDAQHDTGQADESPSEEPSAEADATTERKPNRAERRIRDLVAENKRLQEQYNQPLPFQRPPQPMFEDGREYTAQELEQKVVQAADNIAQLRTQSILAQERAQSNLDRDVEVLPKEYPELDDTSDNFVPELVEAIEEDFKARAFRNGQLDPSVRLADVAKRHIKAARAVAQKSSAEMKNAVAKSADTGAIKPSGKASSNKPFAEKSIKEMEAELGFAAT